MMLMNYKINYNKQIIKFKYFMMILALQLMIQTKNKFKLRI